MSTRFKLGSAQQYKPDELSTMEWAILGFGVRPIFAAAAAALPRQVCDDSTTVPGASDNCGICLSAYAIQAQTLVLRCSHRFCIKCLYTWMARSLTCPACRGDVFADEIRQCIVAEHADIENRHAEMRLELRQRLELPMTAPSWSPEMVLERARRNASEALVAAQVAEAAGDRREYRYQLGWGEFWRLAVAFEEGRQSGNLRIADIVAVRSLTWSNPRRLTGDAHVLAEREHYENIGDQLISREQERSNRAHLQQLPFGNYPGELA